MRKVGVSVLCLAALVAAGCGGGLKDQIQGKWSHKEKAEAVGMKLEGEMTYEFLPDGTVKTSGGAMGFSMEGSGKYTVVDANTIEIEGGGKKTKMKVSVSGDKLTMTGEDGKALEFTKVK
jgi:hypothetical protein